jgi:hypothetical protein
MKRLAFVLTYRLLEQLGLLIHKMRLQVAKAKVNNIKSLINKLNSK